MENSTGYFRARISLLEATTLPKPIDSSFALADFFDGLIELLCAAYKEYVDFYKKC